jgi:peptidoglycan L-alanyl-D-glutamate endopeptidase CwlK
MRDDRVNELNRARLSTLEPGTGNLGRRHVAACREAGITLLVTQAYRDMDEQAALYAKGRTEPGRVVTNARPGYSWHNFRRAYDVAVVDGGQVIWAGPEYVRAGEIGKSLGLVWGGGFGSIKGDLGHFEYHPGMTLARARSEAGIT